MLCPIVYKCIQYKYTGAAALVSHPLVVHVCNGGAGGGGAESREEDEPSCRVCVYVLACVRRGDFLKKIEIFNDKKKDFLLKENITQ